MASLGNLVVHIGANTSGFTRAMNSVTNSMNSSKLKKGGNTPGAGIVGGMSVGGMTKAVVGANMLTAALKQASAWMAAIVSKATALAAQTESTKLTFEVLTGGNKSMGDALFGEMERIAKDTSLTLADTTAAARQLLVTFDAPQVPKLVEMLGNISSGMDNVSLQEMAFLLQTSAEEGKLLARDLRQFTTRGIALPGALKQVLGLVGPGSATRLNEMISAGQVTMDKTMQALELLSNTTYKDMLARQGATLAGRMTQFEDSMQFALRDIGVLFVEAFNVKGVFETLTGWVRSFQEQLWKVKPIVEEAAQAFWSWVTAIQQMWSTFTTALASLGESTWSWGEIFMVVFATMQFTATHWQDIMLVAMLKINMGFHAFVGGVEHMLTVEIPAYWKYMSENSMEVMYTAFEYITTALINVGSFLREFFTELWDWIASGGNDAMKQMEFDLFRGAVSTLPPMAEIPARVLTDYEKQMADELAALGATLGTSYQDSVAFALEQFYANKQPGKGPGLGPAGPYQFDTAASGGGKGDKTGLMQGTQEAWTAILGSMSQDPVVQAIQHQTKQQKEDAEAARKAINEANRGFAGMGGFVVPEFP